jgi:hypothetical protein
MTWLEGAGGLVGRTWRWLRRERPAPDLLIVRKGLSPAYYFFCKMFAQERGLEMMLDRRRAEDRRKPESNLDKDDFCVVKETKTRSKKPGN